jgi:hypothetical protein
VRFHKDIHIALISKVVAGKVTERVSNFEKVGSSDWEHRKLRKAIAAWAVSVDDVYRPVLCREYDVAL